MTLLRHLVNYQKEEKNMTDKKTYLIHDEMEPISRKDANKYHHTQIDLNAKSMTLKEIIDEISVTQDIPVEDVRIILNNYIDIIEREIVSKGSFNIPRILSVKSNLWNIRRNKITKVENQFDENGFPLYINPPISVRPKVKLSETLKGKYIMARRIEGALLSRVAPEDWWKPYVIEDSSKIDQENYNRYVSNTYREMIEINKEKNEKKRAEREKALAEKLEQLAQQKKSLEDTIE